MTGPSGGPPDPAVPRANELPAPSTGELQEAAVRGTAWTALQASLGIPLAIVANVIVARELGPKEFGIVATLITAFAIATTIANAGVSDATVQWGSAANARARPDDLSLLVRRCAGYHILFEAPLIVVVTAVLLHRSSWETQLGACVAAGASMAIGTSAVAHVALSRTATLARATLLVSTLVQVAVVATAVTSHSGSMTWAARTIVGSIVSFVLYTKLPRDLRRAVLQPMLPRGWPKAFVPYALKAGVGAIVSTLVFSRSEIFVLQANDLAAAAGVFALAYGISSQLTAPVDAILGPMIPAAASLAATEPERVAAALLRGLRVTALGTGLLVALAVPPASALVAGVYGQRYGILASLLVPLALVSCIQSLNHPLTAFLYATRHVGSLLVINTFAFAVDILVALATVPTLHVWGAVLANSVGQLIALAAAGTLLHRHLQVPLRTLLSSMRAFGAGVLAGAAAWTVASIAEPSWHSAPAAAAASVAAGAIAFTALVRASARPILTRHDLELILQAVPRRTRPSLARAAAALRLAAPGATA